MEGKLFQQSVVVEAYASHFALISAIKRGNPVSCEPQVFRDRLVASLNAAMIIVEMRTEASVAKELDYAIVALLDEVIANKMPSLESEIGKLTLSRHQDLKAGIEIFERIGRRLADPSNYDRERLLCYHLCLSHGFEGRYTELAVGRNKRELDLNRREFENKKAELWRALNKMIGDLEALEPMGFVARGVRLPDDLPLWVPLLSATLISLALVFGVWMSLGGDIYMALMSVESLSN